jgi:hypothetical protein
MKVVSKNKMKAAKAAQTGATEEAAEVVETVAEETAIAEEATEADEVEEAGEENKAAEADPAVSASPATTTHNIGGVPPTVSLKKKEGYVTFACTRNIDPPPRIGKFDVGHELNIRKMSVGGRYALPAHVAAHLVDAGAGVIA